MTRKKNKNKRQRNARVRALIYFWWQCNRWHYVYTRFIVVSSWHGYGLSVYYRRRKYCQEHRVQSSHTEREITHTQDTTKNKRRRWMLKREGRNRINTSAQNKLWGVKCEQARCIGCAIDTDRSLYPCLSRPVSDCSSNERRCFALWSQSYITKRHEKSYIQRKIQTFHFLKQNVNKLAQYKIQHL